MSAGIVEYGDFLRAKERRVHRAGIDVSAGDLHPHLFPFQRATVAWAAKLGRAAIFANTGLGKTLMQIEWARVMGGRAMILAPLAVSSQTAREARTIGLDITICRDDSDVRDGINITNYERLEKFDLSRFDSVVLDESSILKSFDGKMRAMLTEQCGGIRYRLACTATPSPNDTMELGNHAEFLGVMRASEMLATYFTHDGGETQKWRLKGHARKEFWRWVASWGAMIQRPSDIGFDDSGYDLPPLRMHEHIVSIAASDDRESLFAMPALGLNETRRARKESITERVAQAAEIIRREPGAWIVWCELNAEADALQDAIPGAIEIRGSDSAEEKERGLLAFSDGAAPILISKPSICGFGMNWQHCHKMLFVGISYSWESFYQAIRRCYRFGQTLPVDVHLILSGPEQSVLEALKRKERDAQTMQAAMVAAAMEGFAAQRPRSQYSHPKVENPSWLKTLS